MKTKTIRTITIEDFKRDPHLIDYVDDIVNILLLQVFNKVLMHSFLEH